MYKYWKITLIFIFTSGCVATWSAKQKTAAGFVVGSVVGASIGYALSQQNKDEADYHSTVATNALAGNLIGGGIAYALFDESPDEKRKALRRELELYKEANALPSQKYKLEGFHFQTSKELPPHLKYGTQCSGKIIKMCPSSKSGFSSCEQPEAVFLNPHWAVQYVAYLSPEGCFSPEQFSQIPGFKSYLDHQFDITSKKGEVQ